MDKNLLICIAHHYTDSTFDLVCNLIANIQATYTCKYKIVVHVNTDYCKELLDNKFKDLEVIVAYNLAHPYHLTWQHRQYMKDNIDNYDAFMYVEDDMIVNYDQVCNYLDQFNRVWPNYVPAFVRYEIKNGTKVKYSTDLLDKITVDRSNLRIIEGVPFVEYCIYNACWLCPKEILMNEINKPSFIGISDQGCGEREIAAFFVTRTLGKPCLIQLDKNSYKLSDLILIHHSSNLYCNCESVFGRHEIDTVLSIKN
jgi:hypothetical protein